ncbi:hypothetical protein IPN35_06665 [Candidatus Peregrinibacteria bacterium]|nr:MAG: hypothetical protein IPN35_06665 [Candidatus Peregrinibacteria bacterium]
MWNINTSRSSGQGGGSPIEIETTPEITVIEKEQLRKIAEGKAQKYIGIAQQRTLHENDLLEIKGINLKFLSPETRGTLESFLSAEKDKKEMIALLEKPGEIQFEFRKLFTKSTPQAILKEGEESWDEKQRRDYFGRYFDLLWNLAQDPNIRMDVRRFVLSYFSAELLQNIPKTARENAANLIDWARKMNVQGAREEVDKNYFETATQGREMIGKKKLNEEAEVSQNQKTPAESMLKKIAILNNPDISRKAQEMIANEQAKTRAQQRKLMEKLAFLVFTEIQHNTEEALKKCGEELKEIWEDISQLVSDFLPAVGEMAAQDSPENPEEWKNIATKVILGKGKRIELLLRLAQEGSEEEILASLQADIKYSTKSEQEEIRMLHHLLSGAVGATGKHIKETNEDIPKIYAEIEKASDDRFSASQSSGAKEEAIQNEEHIPKTYELKCVQEWAKEIGISEKTVAQVAKSLSSISTADPLHQEKFFLIACKKHPELQHISEGELKTLFEEFCSHELTEPFVEAGGDLRRYVLLSAAKEMENLVKSSLWNAVDGMNGKDIREEGLPKHPLEELNISQEELESIFEEIRNFPKEGLSKNARQLLQDTQSAAELLSTSPEEFQKVLENIATSDLPLAVANIKKTKQVLQSLFISPEPTEIDEDSPLFQKQREREAREKGISLKEAQENIKQRVRNAQNQPRLSVSEQLREGLEILGKTRQDPVSLKNTAKLQEKGREIREGFHTLLSWGLEEYPNETEVINLREIKNIVGENVIKPIQDDMFEKEYSHETIAIFHVPQKNVCHIFLRQSDYQILFDENINPERKKIILQTLSHEILHLADFSGKTKFSKQLFRDLQNAEGGKALIEQFSKKLGKNHKSWGKLWKETAFGNREEIQTELLAHLLAGNADTEMQDILREIQRCLGENYVKNLRKEMQNSIATLEPENLDKGLLAASNTQSSKESPDQEMGKTDGENYYHFEFEQRKNSILSKLPDIEKEGGKGAGEYIQNVREKLEALQKAIYTPDVDFKKILEDTSTLEDEVNGALSSIADAQQEKGGFLGDLWNNTTFLSLADIGRMWETIKEYTKRKYERRSKLRSGTAGKAIFGNTALGSDFNNNIQNAEADEVGNYKKALDQMDPWQVMGVLSQSKNKDELKACLLRLSELGAIDWTDKNIWRGLEKFQNVARFLPSDANNQISLRAKLNRACGAIWDQDFYPSTERKNRSSVEGKKNEYADMASGDLNYKKSIADMLTKRANGENVDPSRFYAYVELDIKGSNTDPILMFWNLVQGVRRGLLTMDNIKKMEGANHNQYAPIRWFGQVKATPQYLSGIGEVFSDKNEPGSMPNDFREWFYTHVLTLSDIRERIIKSAATGGWDHDMAVMQGSIGNANTAKTHFSTINTGKSQHDPTAYPNMMVGMLMNISSMARHPEEFSDEKDLFEKFAEHIEYTTAFMAYGGGRMFNIGNAYGKDKFHTLGPTELNGRARMASSYGADNGKAEKGKDFLDRHTDILQATGIDFFSFLDAKTTTREEEQQNAEHFLHTIEQQMPGSVTAEVRRLATDKEGVLQSIGQILRNYYEKNPEGALRIMKKAFSTTRKIYSDDHKESSSIASFSYQRGESATPTQPPNLYQ